MFLDNVRLSLPLSSGEHLEILKGVSLDIPVGTVCGLIGPSGSGKTSLLTIISGLRHQTSGKVSCLGMDYEGADEEQLAGFRCANIGIIFQNFHLLPVMTALENVAMPLELANVPDAEQAAAEALQMVGMGDRLEHYPHQLSGGEQQRTAIARAFVAKPRLILADEPTGNLDSETSDLVMETLLRMTSEAGASMLLITHNNELLEHTSMVVRMADGALSS